MQPFDSKIQKVIKKFSYPIWFIHRDPKIICTCVKFSTKQPDKHCKKCLGTGRKIYIKRIQAARQPFRLSITGEGLSSEYNLYTTYYTLNDVNAAPYDLFIDNNEVDVIQDRYDERSNESKSVYYRYLVAPKKQNKELFLKMFNDVIGGVNHA